MLIFEFISKCPKAVKDCETGLEYHQDHGSGGSIRTCGRRPWARIAAMTVKCYWKEEHSTKDGHRPYERPGVDRVRRSRVEQKRDIDLSVHRPGIRISKYDRKACAGLQLTTMHGFVLTKTITRICGQRLCSGARQDLILKCN